MIALLTTRKKIITCGLFLLLMLSSSLTSAAEKLTVWCISDDIPKFEFIIDMYKEKNPNVQIELHSITGGQAGVTEKLAVAIASGAAPDVAWFEGSTIIEFAARGMLTDLTHVLAGLQFTPVDTIEMTYNGKMWGVPYQTAVRGLFKRVDHFEAVGMNPNVDPGTMDELYDWNKKLTQVSADGRYSRAGLVPWIGNWGAPGWIWTFGGKLLEVNGAVIKPTANYPKNIETFEWLRTWGEFYGTLTPVTAGSAGFIAGSVAMSTESTGSVGTFLQRGVQFTTGRVPNPPGGQNGTWGSALAVGVPVGAQNIEAAFKLVRYFGEAESQMARFAVLPAGMPSNWEALLTVGRKLPKEYTPLLNQFPEARPRTPLWLEYYVSGLNPAMNQVLRGAITAEQALTDLQTKMEIRYRDLFGQ